MNRTRTNIAKTNSTTTHVACPRCHYPKARPNAKGADHIFCRKCGGLVPCNYQDDDGPYANDPVFAAIAKEDGLDKAGRIRRDRPRLRGGIHAHMLR